MKANHGMNLRIASLAPSASSILCAIGAKCFLVGVTKWCADVAPVGNLPKLGDCWHLKSVDDILRLKPTLVIGSVPYKQETVARLLGQRLNFLAMNPRTLADIEADIHLLGGIAHRAAAAEKLVKDMRKTFTQFETKARRFKKRLRVYCEAWPNPRISSPPWVAELVRICGGEMALPAGEKITDAQVAAANPEIIVLAWAATGMKSNPRQSYKVAGWEGVAAIRNRQVHAVSDELLNTPGPPLVEGVRELWKVLHQCKHEEKDNERR
jgi:iron complex transport system substrate-binding protein